MPALTALESIGVFPLKETRRDEHGNVIEERYPPETAALRKERGIKEPGEVEE